LEIPLPQKLNATENGQIEHAFPVDLFTSTFGLGLHVSHSGRTGVTPNNGAAKLELQLLLPLPSFKHQTSKAYKSKVECMMSLPASTS